jgi:predicted permease
MARSFIALRGVDLGFAAEQTIAARVSLNGPRYEAPGASQAFFAALAERVRAVPGVEAVGLASMRPFAGAGPATSFHDPAHPLPQGVEPPTTDVRTTDGAYFRTLRIPVLAGSTFDETDRPDAPPRVVVSQAFARALWGTENVVGRRVAINMYNGIQPVVIGVVGDVHLFDARTPARPTAYLAESRFPSTVRDVIVRGGGDPQQLIAALRAVVTALDPTLPVYQATTLTGLVDRSLARDRFTALLLGAFAVVSLLLAGVGIYGVFSGDVTQRRKEIGIRVALGARPAGVIGLVLRRALTRAGIGIALGVLAALGLARSMRTLLFGVTSSDPASFIVVTVVLAVVAVVATLVPAIRAARVSPLTAIRTD